MENNNQFEGRNRMGQNQQGAQDFGYNNYGQQGSGGPNRVNYGPDNDDNRVYPGSGYAKSGAYSSDYGYLGSNEPDRYGNTAYGRQYYEERDRMRHQDDRKSGGQFYGGDFGNRDYGRSRLSHNYGSAGTSYQHQGYGSSADGYRSDYAGRGNDFISGSVHYGYPRTEEGQRDRDWFDRTRDKVASWLGDEDARRRRQMDENNKGAYYGKGPRSYQRSQERIQEDVCERLTEDDRVDASNIEVQVSGTDVILTGTVNSKAEKRRAEDLVEAIPGVKHVENRLRVNQDAYAHAGYGSRNTNQY